MREYQICITDDYGNKTWEEAFPVWADAIANLKRIVAENDEELEPGDEVCVHSGVADDGVRVWRIDTYCGTTAEWGNIEQDPLFWWDTDWDDETDYYDEEVGALDAQAKKAFKEFFEGD